MGFLNPYNCLFLKTPMKLSVPFNEVGERGTDSMTILRGRGIAVSKYPDY